jgi:hypothetical protein
MAALSVSNAVDLTPRDAREARYLDVVRRYKALGGLDEDSAAAVEKPLKSSTT